MTRVKQGVAAGVLLLCLMGIPAFASDSEPSGQRDCHAVVAMLEEQNTKLSGELRRIHREIAALRADLDKPGFKEVAAGIGYILGLFGVAAFVSARRKE